MKKIGIALFALFVSRNAYVSNFGGAAELLVLFVVGTIIIGFGSYYIAFKNNQDTGKLAKWIIFFLFFFIAESVLVGVMSSQ